MLVNHKHNLFILFLISFIALSLPLVTKLVQLSQDDRSSAAEETSKSKISFKISFKGVKPNYSCLSTLNKVNLEIVNVSNKTYQSNLESSITPIPNETNQDGDQVFLVSNLSLSSKFNSINNFNYLRVFNPSFLTSRMCLNNQDKKVDKLIACDIDLKDSNTTIYDFSNYPLIPGDLNQDSIVNTSDFSVVKTNIDSSADSQCDKQGDINFDGMVNVLDLGFLKKFLLAESDQNIIDISTITSTSTPTPTKTPTVTPKLTLTPTPTPTKLPAANYKIHFIKSTNTDGNVKSDSILLESNGKYGLIDGGWKNAFPVISSYLDNVGVKKIEFFLITHPHADHYGSYQKLIERYKPKTLYKKRFFGGNITSAGGLWTKEVINWYSNLEKDIKTICDNNEVNVVNVDVNYNDGWFFNLDKTKITLLNVPDRREKSHSLTWVTDAGMENRNSLVQLIEMNGFKIAMFGDLSWSEWYPYYAKKIGKVDLTKVGHHSIEKNENNKIADFLRSPYLVLTNKNKTDVGTKMKSYAGNNIYYTGNGNIVFDFSSQTIKISK